MKIIFITSSILTLLAFNASATTYTLSDQSIWDQSFSQTNFDGDADDCFGYSGNATGGAFGIGTTLSFDETFVLDTSQQTLGVRQIRDSAFNTLGFRLSTVDNNSNPFWSIRLEGTSFANLGDDFSTYTVNLGDTFSWGSNITNNGGGSYTMSYSLFDETNGISILSGSLNHTDAAFDTSDYLVHSSMGAEGEVCLEAVPEPSSLLLLGIVVPFAALRRRR